MAKVISIKASCNGQGCEIRKVFLPQGIVKDIKTKVSKPKAA
jgi:hypothetical protein